MEHRRVGDESDSPFLSIRRTEPSVQGTAFLFQSSWDGLNEIQYRAEIGNCLSKKNLTMSYTRLTRTVPNFEHTEILNDFPLESIRLVEVPHMAKLFQDSETIENVRTNVGIAGEL